MHLANAFAVDVGNHSPSTSLNAFSQTHNHGIQDVLPFRQVPRPVKSSRSALHTGTPPVGAPCAVPIQTQPRTACLPLPCIPFGGRSVSTAVESAVRPRPLQPPVCPARPGADRSAVRIARWTHHAGRCLRQASQSKRLARRSVPGVRFYQVLAQKRVAICRCRRYHQPLQIDVPIMVMLIP